MSEDKVDVFGDPIKEEESVIKTKFLIGDVVKSFNGTVGEIAFIDLNSFSPYKIRVGGEGGHIEHFAEIDLQLVKPIENRTEEDLKPVDSFLHIKKADRSKLKAPVNGKAEIIQPKKWDIITNAPKFIKG